MIYRPPVRRSSIAGLGRALGAFALPLLIISVVGHRFGLMATDHAVVLALSAFGFAAVALVFAVFAVAVVWHDGRLGARHAVTGLIYAVLALIPAGWTAFEALRYPRLVDVATDAVDPPMFRTTAMRRVGLMNSPRPPALEERRRIKALTPDLATRRFTVGSDLLYAVTRRQVEAEGWTFAEQVPPQGDGDSGRIEAEARSLVFGFRDDVVIRILPEPNGARIDLRSSTRWGDRDFGRNARRIRGFLDDLDKAVVATYGG